MGSPYGLQQLLDSPHRDGPGSYQIVFELPAASIQVGRLGLCEFGAGVYVYSGSALRGIRQRVLRHLRAEKRLHWHIDYVLAHAHIIGVRHVVSTDRLECALHRAVVQALGAEEPIKGFGASDCRCRSHLARLREPLSLPEMDRRLRNAVGGCT